MKKIVLSVFFLLSITLTIVANQKENFWTINTNSQAEIYDFLKDNDDCGGCIAYADSRDDGSDRTLTKWRNDLETCRANSVECQEQQ